MSVTLKLFVTDITKWVCEQKCLFGEVFYVQFYTIVLFSYGEKYFAAFCIWKEFADCDSYCRIFLILVLRSETL